LTQRNLKHPGRSLSLVAAFVYYVSI
jgi:hypothetical protein